jgi:short-chain fatty acids transporter
MRRVGNALAWFSTRFVPEAFVFALLLTFAVYVVALVTTDHGPLQLVDDWYGGFWGLLEFAMQMTLVLVTGYALASSPVVARFLRWLSSLPRSNRAAVALTALAAGLAGWVHWGLGLVVGALLAREMARSTKERGIRTHFPLLAAAGYVGLMVWHSGLSGSAPLLVNTEGHFLEEQIGLVDLGDTIFRPFNLVFVVLAITVSVVVLASMHPSAEDTEEIADEPSDGAGGSGSSRTAVQARPRMAEKLSHSRVLVGAVVVGGLVYLVPFYADSGVVGLDLNVVNFTFLILGLAAHGTLADYAEAAANGARAASGVIVQFPFYAGIMGIMASSGLAEQMSNWFIDISNETTFPFFALLSAGIVNFAVPSGGGQWAVQGPIMTGAADGLGVDQGIAVMAVAMGDQLTNMIQPFWALPLLGITGLKPGQMLGYTAAIMLAAFAIAGLCITFLA